MAVKTLLLCMNVPALAVQIRKHEQEFAKVASSSLAAGKMLADLLQKLQH
jgi:hypothetical protein